MIYARLADYPRSVPVALALGTFDGVHLGHRALIAELRGLAEAANARAVAFTFANHPLVAITGRAPEPLMSPEEKAAALLDAGADDVIMVPFDKIFMNQSASSFLRASSAQLNLRALAVGYNFTFGKGGEGNAATLMRWADERGLQARILPKVDFQGLDISSTRIRRCLEAGEIELANALLGRPYDVSGTVVRGRQLGRTLGFPTANVRYATLLPKGGVYVTEALVGGTHFPAMTNIGRNPTVADHNLVTMETYLIGEDLDLYGRRLNVRFHHKLRDERRFASLDALKVQLQTDADTALAWLNARREKM